MNNQNHIPVIGIFAHQIHRPEQPTSPPIDGLYGDYCRAVALAGGAPLLIPLKLSEPAWRSIYERLDGLLFPGGVDVAPSFYGEPPHPQLGKIDDALDKAEMLFARWALTDALPILGICRGIQLLNVAAGGALYQHIPAQIPNALTHAWPDTSDAHRVDIDAGTRLAAALGATSCQTNSRHHQAIKTLAPRFIVTARAPDGVIEGIERPDAPFIVAVQWHPENMAPTNPLMLRLFQAFVRACQTRNVPENPPTAESAKK